MDSYFSFLLCHHPDRTLINVYVNGLQLGIVRDGVMEPDPLFEQRNPFKTRQELRAYLLDVVNKAVPDAATTSRSIFIDGTAVEIAGETISYEEVIERAPGYPYTRHRKYGHSARIEVTYVQTCPNGAGTGVLKPGEQVAVMNGMHFILH